MLKRGGFSFARSARGTMKFSKPPLTLDQQADLLLSRGLIADKAALVARLSSVSYYRLCAYWFPFKQRDETFVMGTTLETVWRRYTFDRQFRLLVMDAIERVEITLRGRLAYELTHRFGTFAHLDPRALPSIQAAEYARLMDELHDNAQRSREAFVDHFRKTYDEFPDLPLWAAVETMTFGQMLTLFRNCGKHVQRGHRFGLPFAGNGPSIMAVYSQLRPQLMRHHSRLWNRELAIKPLIPHARHDPRWHTPTAVRNDRPFVVLTVLRYLLTQTAQQSQWRERLYSLFDRYPETPLINMGMANNWRDHPLWK